MADLLERRWQLSIIYAALSGALRFNEFADAVAGISPRMLSERLRDLEAAGLVERTVIPSSPPTVEYRLTKRGRRLGPIRHAIVAQHVPCFDQGALPEAESALECRDDLGAARAGPVQRGHDGTVRLGLLHVLDGAAGGQEGDATQGHRSAA